MLQGSSVEVDAGVVVVPIAGVDQIGVGVQERIAKLVEIGAEAVGVLHADDFGDGIVVVAELRHPIVAVGERHGVKGGCGQQLAVQGGGVNAILVHVYLQVCIGGVKIRIDDTDITACGGYHPILHHNVVGEKIRHRIFFKTSIIAICRMDNNLFITRPGIFVIIVKASQMCTFSIKR